MEEFLKRLAPIWRPHPGQRKFLEAVARLRVLACGRRWGKTDACAVDIVARIHRGPPSTTFVVAPTQDQALILFERVLDIFEALGIELPKFRRSPFPKLHIFGSFFSARSGHKPRSLRGYGPDHIVVDEAAFLPKGLLQDVLWPMLATSASGTMTLVSTPNGHNEFWEHFQRGVNQMPDTWAHTGPTSENPEVAPEFLAQQENLLSARTFQREYEACFASLEGALFRAETIRDSVCGDIIDDGRGPYFVGVDFGRHTDYTAICVVSGVRSRARVVYLQRFRQLHYDAQVAKLVVVLAEFPGAMVCCDRTGAGDPVWEQLKAADLEHRFEGLTFNNHNKWEMYERLSVMFERGHLQIPPDDELIKELLEMWTIPCNGPHPRIEARSGHDDLATSLALACRHLPTEATSLIAATKPREF